MRISHENQLAIKIAGMVHWKELKDRTQKNQRLYEQHYTTTTKLDIAKRHFKRIIKIIPNQKATDLGLIISKDKFGYGPSFLEKSTDYLSELDGFSIV